MVLLQRIGFRWAACSPAEKRKSSPNRFAGGMIVVGMVGPIGGGVVVRRLDNNQLRPELRGFNSACREIPIHNRGTCRVTDLPRASIERKERTRAVVVRTRQRTFAASSQSKSPSSCYESSLTTYRICGRSQKPYVRFGSCWCGRGGSDRKPQNCVPGTRDRNLPALKNQASDRVVGGCVLVNCA